MEEKKKRRNESSNGTKIEKYRQAVDDFLQLPETERKSSLAVGLGQEGFVPDEIVAILMLRSWRDKWQDVDFYAQHLIQRLTKHVRAHVGKNPGWQDRGGGFKVTADDFCNDIFEAMLMDKVQPCHAEVAFGDYVKKRCLDCADKLYAKKRSAGSSLDVDGVKAEVEANQCDHSDLSADSLQSPEEYVIQNEEYIEKLLADKQKLIRIEEVVQLYLSDNERMAFTFHYYGKLKVYSKKPEVMTVSKVMGAGESSVRHYLTNARKIIKEKLT